MHDVRRYAIASDGGLALAVTDAVALPDGRVLVSAAAEDSPNAYDDGPVLGSALALLDDETTVATVLLPRAGRPGRQGRGARACSSWADAAGGCSPPSTPTTPRCRPPC